MSERDTLGVSEEGYTRGVCGKYGIYPGVTKMEYTPGAKVTRSFLAVQPPLIHNPFTRTVPRTQHHLPSHSSYT